MSLFAKLRDEHHLPGFDGATGWLNSEPLTSEGLRGKVVLVDFWTYTCINWLRTLGYVRAWHEKYEAQGLVVVGVHTPEFPFEHDADNVRWAAKDQRVEYPIALDPDFAVWRAFANNYWPAVYIADAEGRIRHMHFGEGGYEECERMIQALLRDAGREGVADDLVSVDPVGLEAQADWSNLESPETYLGYQQAQNFASADGTGFDEPFTFAVPDSLGLNQWGLSGEWTIGPGASVLNGAEGQVAFRFHARDVHLVMGPPSKDVSVPFRVIDRRRSSRRRSRGRRRRARERDADPAAAPSADSAAGKDRRPHVRDHLRGPRRRGVLLHVRLGARTQGREPDVSDVGREARLPPDARIVRRAVSGEALPLDTPYSHVRKFAEEPRSCAIGEKCEVELHPDVQDLFVVGRVGKTGSMHCRR